MKYDTIIVGGGPAGLSAATHLAWHNRSVLVIDRRTGPLAYTLEKLFNVPGMPAASGPEILGMLRRQAKDLGAKLVKGSVESASGSMGNFRLTGSDGEVWEARTVLLATGVARMHPTVGGDHRPFFPYAGKGNLFYCPDCEAPEIVDRDTVVIAAGHPDGGAGMAVGLSRYTNRLRVLATGPEELSDSKQALLDAKGIPFLRGRIENIRGEGRDLEALVLEDGTEVTADAFFVAGPARGRTDLATQLGVELAKTGVHAQPASQRGNTNVEGVWIAGDLRPMTQQVSVAMGTGNIAAIMIDQTLRAGDVAVQAAGA